MESSRGMMMKLLCMLVLLMGVELTGCTRQETPPPPAPPKIAAGNEQLFKEYQKVPGALVGRVVAVDEGARLAAVGDVKGSDFHEGDVVTFLGADGVAVAQGSVAATYNDAIHVQYEPSPDGRAPEAGDVAIRFSK